MDAGYFRPFDTGGVPLWGAASPQRQPLVLDAWRHRAVDVRGPSASPLPAEGGAALDAALCTLRGGASAGAPSADSTAASLGDLRLSQGSGFAGTGLGARSGAGSPVPAAPGLAEPSERRREAVRGAWRRLDPRGQGAVEQRDLVLALQQASHLRPDEQEQLARALREAAGGQERLPHAAFTAYYQQLGAQMERDRDFEDLMRHHWGFAEVSDLLDDMKNKFAVVGLAYAFRACLEQGAPELSLDGFSESVARLGMHYSGAEVRRLFDAFGPPDGPPGLGRSLEVHRLMQQLTSAPRPSTPVPAFRVGVNYQKLPCRLEGCIADSDAFITLLTEDFGYDVSDIRQLRDDHPQRMPTRRNINAALRWLMSGAKEGDHLLFHYSGHGGQQAGGGGADMDGRDESLVPSDYQQSGAISDDELRRALAQGLPRGARLTVLLDCCHGGAALELPYCLSLQEGDAAELRRRPQPLLPDPLGEGEVVVLSARAAPGQASPGPAPGCGSAPQGTVSAAFRAAIRRHPEGSFHAVLSDVRRFLAHHGAQREPRLSCARMPRLWDAFLPEARRALAPAPALRPPVRKALTVGVDYLALWPGQGRLSGCIGDSEAVVGALRGAFRFEDAQIVQLRDDRPDVQPTRANVLASLQWLAQGAQPGDELFLHFSGHGSAEGALLPCDFQATGPLGAEELCQTLVAPLPPGCRLWAVLDGRGGNPLLGSCGASVSADGRSMQLQLGGAPPRDASGTGGVAEVIALSAGSEAAGGSAAPAASLTAAFVKAVAPTASCEEVLLRTRQLLRQAGSTQEPRLSSERPVQLDSSFLAYSATPVAPAPASAPPAPAPAAAPATEPAAAPLGAPLSPMHRAPLDVDTGAYVMDSRINRLEQQIAQLRRQSRSPAPLSPSAAGALPGGLGMGPRAASWGQVPRAGGVYG